MTFIDCGKLKILSSADDGNSQPVCYAPEPDFTVGYNDTLNTYTCVYLAS